jgi:predicted nucleotidyltransferase
MSVTALITEYNPFHNGHQYHLNQSKKITDSEHIIVIMNGNFTQRAEAALLDKWARTKQALSCGADLVIELPLVYGIRSAEYFAHYSIKILEKSNLVDHIVFGSESGQINILKAIAHAFNNESSHFKKKLSNYINQGFNYPKARQKALIDAYDEYEELKKYDKNLIKNTLKNPNNILGIEYLKSIEKINSQIKTHTIKRIGPEYYSDRVEHLRKDIASATHIRNLIYNNNKKNALTKSKNLMPEKAWEILKNELNKGHFSAKSEIINLNKKIIDQIRRLSPSKLKAFPGISNGLENRIYKTALDTGNPEYFLENIKSKNYTESRIKRMLLHIYLNLNKENLKKIYHAEHYYIRILGINKDKEHLLREINNKSNLPVIINPAQIIKNPDLDTDNPFALSLSYDILASDLYALLYQNQNLRQARRDYHQKLIKF